MGGGSCPFLDLHEDSSVLGDDGGEEGMEDENLEFFE